VNFNYDDDVDGVRCPFHAHIRKANPRGDKVREFGLPAGEDRSRRIARRGVPYPPGASAGVAPAAGTDVGLLFICAQSSIVHQFEFIQSIWSNFTDFLRPKTGLDTVIGQGHPDDAPVPQKWPKDWGVRRAETLEFDFSTWVTLRGGEYFFLPSISFLKGLSVGN
jgi:deferrochelatase/peroxidase EfeB